MNKALHNRVTLSGLWAVLQLEIRGKETDSIYWEQVLQTTNIGAMRSRSVCVCAHRYSVCAVPVTSRAALWLQHRFPSQSFHFLDFLLLALARS